MKLSISLVFVLATAPTVLSGMAQATAGDTHSFLRGAEDHLDDHRQLDSPWIVLGSCEDFAVMAGSTATCAGAPDCAIVEGTLGVSPGTSITGNFDAVIPSTVASANCAKDGLAAWTAGTAMTGGIPLAKMEGETIHPGKYVSSSIGFSTKVYLDADWNSNAQFVFKIGTTLTTSDNSEVVLLNGARAENVFWVLGTALTTGAHSILQGNVLAGSSITMGTHAKIIGRAIAQAAVTCETACTVDSSVTPEPGKSSSWGCK